MTNKPEMMELTTAQSIELARKIDQFTEDKIAAIKRLITDDPRRAMEEIEGIEALSIYTVAQILSTHAALFKALEVHLRAISLLFVFDDAERLNQDFDNLEKSMTTSLMNGIGVAERISAEDMAQAELELEAEQSSVRH